MSYKLAVAIFFDTRDCKPLKKYRNTQYSYSSCARYYFFSLGGRRGGGHLFEAGCLLTFSTPRVGAYSRLGA